MVVLSEITSVFWGVILEGGKKKYTQTTEKPVHISMAALDPSQPCGDIPVSVMIEHGTGSYVLCTLQKGSLFQQPLNLEFAAGEEISLFVKGNGSVHLSGYVMPEDDYQQYGDMSDDDDLSEQDMESDDEEDSDEEAVTKQSKKRQIVDATRASKRAKITLGDMADDDDEEDSDDEDFIIDEAEEASDDEEDEDEDEDEEEDSVEESPKPVGKNKKIAVVDAVKANSNTPSAKNKGQSQNDKNKATKQTPAAAAAATPPPKADGESENKKKKKKKRNKKNKGENQQQTPESSKPSTPASPAPASKVPPKRVAEGGVVIEDVKQGHGPEAKVGKKVAVYYTGRLSNGKVFDCCTSGNGFKFKLGKKEVISGWDVGVSGMKVGGKRKLVIPPKMGYGASAAGPIPANSTLVFDVELKSVG